MVTSRHHAIVCCESKMNNETFTAMLAAIRSDRKIEAIRCFQRIMAEQVDQGDVGLKFAKDFIAALMFNVTSQSDEASPTYRFGVVYRVCNGEHQYSSYLDLAEAQRSADAMVSNPEFDLDYCHIVEIKQSATTKTVYTMQPFVD